MSRGGADTAITALRVLAMDGVEAARSGHPGLPLAMAPAAFVLYGRIMRHDPGDPNWPDRDRFILSAGHGSMLLYGALHLSGYDLPLEQLRRFRQWGSATPGHPERAPGHDTPGVETTTGPLGQGFANGVGMAMAERFLRERYGSDLVDHRVFAICSDGDLMEGVASEAASLAGHLGLGRLVYLYDDNGITIDGSTRLSFSESVDARFTAYGWRVDVVEDANDVDALERALRAACDQEARPSLIRVRSIIGWPSPGRQGTSAAHGAPLGTDEVRATKRVLGVDPELEFAVPPEAYEAFSAAARSGARERELWQDRVAARRGADPELMAEWDRAWSGRPMAGVRESLPRWQPDDGRTSTRAAGGAVMAAFAPLVPTMVGGSADLAESTKAALPGAAFDGTRAGRTVHWGVREHAMGAAVNGLALHGGIVRPYGSTFLVFSDYMRPSIRLSALMQLPVAWVFTHDSVALGEDGPTHQPVEQLASLRAIPGLTVIRPADANETAAAWEVILDGLPGPAGLVLTRQDVPVLEGTRERAREGVARGGYVLADAEEPGAILIASGSEVALALDARTLLQDQGIPTRVVSLASWELFQAQPAEYRESVLPAAVGVRVAIEAGASQGWERWTGAGGRVVAIDRFGASAPGPEVLERLGITARAAADAVLALCEAAAPGALTV